MGSPEGFANDLQILRSSMMGFATEAEPDKEIARASFISLSTKTCSVLGDGIQRPPNHAVSNNYEHRHDGNTKGEAREIASIRHLRDICAKSRSSKFGMSPADRFGDHACVPRTT